MMKEAFLFIVRISSAAIESPSCNKPAQATGNKQGVELEAGVEAVTLCIMTLLMLAVCVYNPYSAGHGAQMMLERLL